MGGLLRNYENPPIPVGYHYVEGNWKEGFVIEREYDESQFVWVPVGFLNSNGTLDGRHFKEKFGRRTWGKASFSDKYYHENLTKELLEQVRSIKKYGGFYLSRFNISKSTNGVPQSKKGEKPWVDVSFEEAKKIAKSFETSEGLSTHLMYGAEYDSVLNWVVKSNSRMTNIITIDSTIIGNHLNSRMGPGRIVETGSRKEWHVNQIFDLAGNVYEMTQEEYGRTNCTLRGACYKMLGFVSSAVDRVYVDKNKAYDDVGMRIAMTISENAKCEYI